MLVIPRAQMAVFDREAARAFEIRTYAHLLRYFPRHCELLGEEQMCRVIRHGWRKSLSYGLDAECCVRSYVDLMCVLGGGFDTDTLLPWAREVLRNSSGLPQVERGDLLYNAAWNYIRHVARDYRDVAGEPTTARFTGELRQFRNEKDRELTPATRQEFATSLFARIERLFPAKCAFVGEQIVRQAISDAMDAAAKRHGYTTERGATLYTIMRFILGGEFDNDPLLPWVSSALHDRTSPDRVATLYREAVSFLRRWWKAPGSLDV